MTEDDLGFVRALLAHNQIGRSVLELGGRDPDQTCRSLIERSGRRYVATDLQAEGTVDFAADFETGSGVPAIAAAGLFETVLVLNVLEHCFNPIAALDNVLRVSAPGGNVVIVSPAVWPLHHFPVDCCRLLPDWYRHFAYSRNVGLLDEWFWYVGVGRVADLRTSDGQDRFPSPAASRPLYRLYCRAVHKAFNTFGRAMMQPSHIAIGAVLALPGKRGR